MADVSDPSELFDLELHEDDKAHDSDDDRIELDDVSKRVYICICINLYENKLRSSGGGSSSRGCACPPLSASAQDFPSLFTFALSVCLCVCSRKFAFSLFGEPNSEAYLLRKCSDHLTKTQRTRRNGVCVVIRLLNNIFHSFALPIKYIFIIIAKNSF